MIKRPNVMMPRLSALAAVLFPLAACSTTTPGDLASDAAATTTCGSADAADKPRCQRGGPCACDDVGGVPPICVGGAWTCPSGSTRFEDCFGVPPAGSFAECVDAGKADAGNGS